MADSRNWNREEFAHNLSTRITELLSVQGNFETLSRAVALCSEEAEKVCAGRQAACFAGCPHCCVLNVAALLPETAVIAVWLKERLSSDEINDLSAKLATHNSWTRWMEDDERITRKAFCPFLDETGRCSIHPVRPLACRGVVSLDSAKCREAFSPVISDDERSILSDLLRRGVFDEAFAVFAGALNQQGIDDRSIELGTGVLAFLTEPAYLARMLSGCRLPRDLWG